MGCTECSFNIKKENKLINYSLQCCCSGVKLLSSVHQAGKIFKFICAWEGLFCPCPCVSLERKICRTECSQRGIVLWTAGKEWGNLGENISLLQGPSWSHRVVDSADRTGHTWSGTPKVKEPSALFGKKVCCNNTLTRTIFLCLFKFNVLYPDLLGTVT